MTQSQPDSRTHQNPRDPSVQIPETQNSPSFGSRVRAILLMLLATLACAAAGTVFAVAMGVGGADLASLREAGRTLLRGDGASIYGGHFPGGPFAFTPAAALAGLVTALLPGGAVQVLFVMAFATADLVIALTLGNLAYTRWFLFMSRRVMSRGVTGQGVTGQGVPRCGLPDRRTLGSGVLVRGVLCCAIALLMPVLLAALLAWRGEGRGLGGLTVILLGLVFLDLLPVWSARGWDATRQGFATGPGFARGGDARGWDATGPGFATDSGARGGDARRSDGYDSPDRYPGDREPHESARGLLTGIVAGLQLTPIILAVHFIVRRDWRGLRAMAVGFFATMGLAWLLRPALSQQFWMHSVFTMHGLPGPGDSGAAGSHADGHASPGGLGGTVLHLVADGALLLWLAALVIVLVGGAGASRVRRRYQGASRKRQ